MKINVIAVGKLKEKYLKDAVNEYTKRLTRFTKVEIIEVEDEKAPDNISEAIELQIKKKEGEKILKKLKDNSTLIVLDLKGEQLTSEGLAQKLNSFFIGGKSDITFVIGGSLGLDDDLTSRADYSLCLSKMTFPHQLARVILLEQIYRGFKIINNEAYHK